MNLKQFNEYIENVRFQEARSYKSTAPHEYTIKGWRKDLERDFNDAVLFIRENGMKENFYRKTFIYLYHDGYKYWTMGDPIETTWVLNRAEVN